MTAGTGVHVTAIRKTRVIPFKKQLSHQLIIFLSVNTLSFEPFVKRTVLTIPILFIESLYPIHFYTVIVSYT